MGVSGGPYIVRDSSLVLELDAADRNSYDIKENLLYYTSQIGTQQSVYYSSASASPLSMSLNAAIAPDGTMTATLINQTGSNTNEYVYGWNGVNAVTLEPNSIYTYSIYAKTGSKDNFSFTIDENGFGGKRYRFDYYFIPKVMSSFYSGGDNNGLILDSGSQEVGNGWVRIYGTFLTSTGSVSACIDMIGRYGNGTGTFYVWGRQLEKKSKPTNYIETTTTPITGSKTWIDLSGNSNSGDFINKIVFDAGNGGSTIFDGNVSSAYITTPSTLTLSNTISFNFWVLSTGQTTYHQTILGKDTNGAPGVPHLLIRRNANSDNLIFNYHDGVSAQIVSISNFFTNVNNYFVNIQITVNYNNGTINVYKNGSLFYNDTISSMIYYPSTSAILSLGNWIPNNGLPFNGKIATTQIYNKILSAQEVLQNYNAVKSRFNL